MSTRQLSGPRGGAQGAKRLLLAVAAIGGVALLLAAGLSLYLERAGAGAPAGYALVAQLDLSERGYLSEPAYRFTLDEVTEVSFYIVLRDIRSGPNDILLKGPDEFSLTFMRSGESYEASHAIIDEPRALELEPGNYRLELTFRQGPGRVYVRQD